MAAPSRLGHGRKDDGPGRKPGGIPLGAIYMDGPPVALSGSFTNPNPAPVNVGGITATIGTVTGGTPPVDPSHPACDATDFPIGGSAPARSAHRAARRAARGAA